MANLTARATRVYAILEAYREGQGDILDTLLPFLEPHLEDISGELLDPAAFAATIQQAYGWNFTPDVVEEFIPRLKAKGWLKESGAANARCYRVTCVPSTQPDEKEQQISAVLQAIGEEFKIFLREISPLSGHNQSADQLGDLLVEWLISIDGYSEAALATATKKVTTVGGKLAVTVDEPEMGSLSPDERYLCARFVMQLFVTESPHIQNLIRLASIGLITEVVQDFSKPTTNSGTTSIAIFLDAPVALDYLGVSGKLARENIEALLAELNRMGASLRIFRQSVKELQRALSALLKRPASDRTGPTADALRRNEVLESYVAAVSRDPEHFLNQLNVQVVSRNLDQFPNSAKHFDKGHYDRLLKRITWHIEERPREHDATVTALVMRTREGIATNDVFKARALLLSRNPMLAALARRFCIEEFDAPDRIVGPVVHQRQLATATWLRSGLGANLDLPRRYLLATCERVLAVKKDVIAQAKHASKKQTPEMNRQLDLLLTQERSTQYLMDRTLGVSDVITTSNIELLVEGMKQQLVAEQQKEADARIREERKKANEKTRRAELLLDSASVRERELEKTLKEQKHALLAIVQATLDATNRTIVQMRWGISILLASISLSLACGPLYIDTIPPEYNWLRYALSAVFGICGTILLYKQLWDRPTQIKNRVEACYHSVLVRALHQRGIAQTPMQLGITLIGTKFVQTPDAPASGRPTRVA